MRSPIAFAAFLLLATSSSQAQSEPAAPSDIARRLPSRLHWTDIDCDGRLDALALTRGGRNRMLRQRDDYGFDDVTLLVGLAPVERAQLASFADVDDDGFEDLACVIDGRLQLLRNEQGRQFVDVTTLSSLSVEAEVLELEWLDVDRDGLADVLVSTPGKCDVFVNRGKLQFERVGLDLALADDLDPLAPGAAAHSIDATRARRILERARNLRNGASALFGGPNGTPTNANELPDVPGSSGNLLVCSPMVVDQATGACLSASSVPTLGTLYPLGLEFNVDATGRVGIGTTTPAEKLEIVGGGVKLGGSYGIAFHRASDGNLGLRVGMGSNGNTLRFYDAGNVRSDILADSTGTHWNILGGTLDITQGGQVRHSFAGTSGKASFGLTSGVGIGAEPNGDFFGVYKEQQWSNAPGGYRARMHSATGALEFANSATNPGLYFVGEGNAAFDTHQAIAVRNSANVDTITLRRDGAMYIGGDVGIGTSTPGAKLDVAGTTETDALRVPTGATSGHVLTSDGAGNATWQAPTGGVGGSGTINRIAQFSASNQVGDSAIVQDSAGQVAINTPPSSFVKFDVQTTTSMSGIRGVSSSGTGVTAWSTSGWGLNASSTSSDGVRANSSTADGVRATSTSGDGVDGTSSTAAGVRGSATSTTAVNYGVYGSTASATGFGVYSAGPMRSTGAFDAPSVTAGALRVTTTPSAGHVLTSDATGNATWQPPTGGGIGGSGTVDTIPRFTASGTIGDSAIVQDAAGHVGIGTTPSSVTLDVASTGNSAPVRAWAHGSSNGLIAITDNGTGVLVQASGGDGVRVSTNSGAGVWATSSGVHGVFAQATPSSGLNYGVYGRTGSSGGYGVYSEGRMKSTGAFEAPSVSTGTLSVTTGAGFGRVLTDNSGSGIATWEQRLDGVGLDGHVPVFAGDRWLSATPSIRCSGAGYVGIGTPPGTTVTLDVGAPGSVGAIRGTANLGGTAIAGVAANGLGVEATSTTNDAVRATSTSGDGLDASSGSAAGVRGSATGTSGVNYGVWGSSASPAGYGVYSNGPMKATGAFDAPSVTAGTLKVTSAPTAGHVLTSDASGNATWQPPTPTGIGGAGTVDTLSRFTASGAIGDSVIRQDSLGHIGIGTASPSAVLDVGGIDGLIARGVLGSGSIPASGAGARMMWYPGKLAFRAGLAVADRWDAANVGEGSVAFGAAGASGNYASAFGSAALATGVASLAAGNNAVASGDQAMALGLSVTASGLASTALGSGTSATGARSLAAGDGAVAAGDNSYAFGQGVRAQSFGSVAIGRFNAYSGNPTAWNWSDPVFQVGAGTSDTNRSTPFSISQSGAVSATGYLAFGSVAPASPTRLRVKANVGWQYEALEAVGASRFDTTVSTPSTTTTPESWKPCVSIKHLSERWNPNATNPLHYLDQAALDVYVRPREPDVHTVPIGIKVEIDEFWNNVDGGATGIWIDAPPFDPYSNGAAIAARGDISTIGNGSFNGNLAVSGTITKGSGTFKIDHPLDPENKYLSHSFVESPDMMNIYNGNATLDAQGEAWVTLPEWFQPLNRDFRYQLTALGKPSPSLYVADEISGNRFRIAGGAPNGRVSWQVTGIRQDAFANAHRVQVEEQKSERDIGSYLHPNEHGLPQERLIGYERIVKPFIDNRAARREKSNRPATRDGAQER